MRVSASSNINCNLLHTTPIISYNILVFLVVVSLSADNPLRREKYANAANDSASGELHWWLGIHHYPTTPPTKLARSPIPQSQSRFLLWLPDNRLRVLRASSPLLLSAGLGPLFASAGHRQLRSSGYSRYPPHVCTEHLEQQLCLMILS